METSSLQLAMRQKITGLQARKLAASHKPTVSLNAGEDPETHLLSRFTTVHGAAAFISVRARLSAV